MDNFREEVEKKLKGLDRGQITTFAWYCGMRGLPFLGARGNFAFWKEENRQRHLYSCFYALDAARAYAADTATDAAGAAAYDAATTVRAAAAYAYAYADAAAAYAAARAAAAEAAYAAARAAAAVDGNRINRINFQTIILGDIAALKKGKKPSVSIEMYGEVWNRFQAALEQEGCGYWGRLYETIFEENFTLDQQALLRRLKVPREIRERGAAAVGNYLGRLEKKGAKRLDEARIIILGDKGAGKTSLSMRLKDPDGKMPEEEDSTAGVDVSLWKPEGIGVNVRIWDFAGHTITHTAHRFFLAERCLYIVVCDGRTERNKTLPYWLDHVKNYGGIPPSSSSPTKRIHINHRRFRSTT